MSLQPSQKPSKITNNLPSFLSCHSLRRAVLTCNCHLHVWEQSSMFVEPSVAEMNPDQVQGHSERQSASRWSLVCLSCAADKIIKKYRPSCRNVKQASGSSCRVSALKSASISKQLSLCPFQRSSLIGPLTPMTFRQGGSRGSHTREERDSVRD